MAYDPETEARLAKFHAETIPCVGGPADGGRSSFRTPGHEFTAHGSGPAGAGRKALYRVNEDGTAAVLVEGTERQVHPEELA